MNLSFAKYFTDSLVASDESLTLILVEISFRFKREIRQTGVSGRNVLVTKNVPLRIS